MRKILEASFAAASAPYLESRKTNSRCKAFAENQGNGAIAK
ncbi:hypothetical protein BAZMOX_349680_1 [methanotrophic endosymbiont of Bathymodiolus azoricus (Menez Gwen)]|nr:hypothetical protein BAZMOX_349680_1 [methanotrophic endosymbiont of Bathymodiolus azoricus (Menez Gwen)]